MFKFVLRWIAVRRLEKRLDVLEARVLDIGADVYKRRGGR